MKWFKHDSNAHRDVKLRKLMMRYGLEGYGLYFYCLERITDKLSTTNLTFRLEDDAEILAHDTGLHIDDVNGMMRFMVELELFEDSQGVITCLKLAKRLDQSQAGNKTMRNLIAKVRENHDGVMTTSGQSHDSVMLEEKRKEKKRIEQKKKDKKEVERPSDVEVQVWDDFLSHRKRLRADVTVTAINRITKEAKKAKLSLNDVLALMVSRGWRGFEASWIEEEKPKQKDPYRGAI